MSTNDNKKRTVLITEDYEDEPTYAHQETINPDKMQTYESCKQVINKLLLNNYLGQNYLTKNLIKGIQIAFESHSEVWLQDPNSGDQSQYVLNFK